MSNLVPFGKYRGQPVEALMADQDYCAWLTAQPWFRERFGGIYQVIINYGQEPVETPEHNEMQAWFLDDDLCRRLARHVAPGGYDPEKTDTGLLLTPDTEIGWRRFEDEGWDVTYVLHWLKVLVECKPVLGDDFPAVLRQVLARQVSNLDLQKRVVVVRRFGFERLKWEQVSEMFWASRIHLVHMPDPEAFEQ